MKHLMWLVLCLPFFAVSSCGLDASGVGGSGTSSTASAGGEGAASSVTTSVTTSDSSSSSASSGSGGAGGGCPGTQESCNGKCTEADTDILNCGACGNACKNTTQLSCVAGGCTGPCGPIPQVGYALCYYALPMTGTEHVGFAGAIVPSGQNIMQIWADPMGSCVNAQAASVEPFVLCDLGLLAANTVVQVEPGLHASQGASTSTFECSSSCTGSAILYLNGAEVGAMTNSIPTGALSLVDHFSPPARKDLQFTAQ